MSSEYKQRHKTRVVNETDKAGGKQMKKKGVDETTFSVRLKKAWMNVVDKK